MLVNGFVTHVVLSLISLSRAGRKNDDLTTVRDTYRFLSLYYSTAVERESWSFKERENKPELLRLVSDLKDVWKLL